MAAPTIARTVPRSILNRGYVFNDAVGRVFLFNSRRSFCPLFVGQ
jgi:hypothetical protein